jgi:hypothetical protein
LLGEIMQIGGINVAAVTPHRGGREIDLAGSLELIDYLCDAGVKGIAFAAAADGREAQPCPDHCGRGGRGL